MWVMSPGEEMWEPSRDTCRSVRAASMSSSPMWLLEFSRSGWGSLHWSCTWNCVTLRMFFNYFFHFLVFHSLYANYVPNENIIVGTLFLTFCSSSFLIFLELLPSNKIKSFARESFDKLMRLYMYGECLYSF